MIRFVIRQYDGDGSLAANGFVVGKQWGNQIANMLSAGVAIQRWRQDVVTFGESGSCYVRVEVEKERSDYVGYIYVQALGGCADIPPFLLKRRAPDWWAYYTDGVVERINPVTRSPRPDPDTAVRTKKVLIPSDLLEGTLRGSMFSGLMRMAVQCRHAAGTNSVFSPTWSRTHGILAYIDQAPANQGSSAAIAAVSATNRYWVIEAAATGVYAAPVTWTGKCCDGFSVAKYMQSGETTLSLSGAFTRGVAGVLRLISAVTMAVPYLGDPFNGNDGWAFSRSGQQAQAVTAQLVGRHYKMERWGIAFTFTGSGATLAPAASVSLLENGDVFFPSTNPLWVPTGVAHKWTAVPRFNPPDISVANGPIHVYFRGETAFVTSYQHSGPSVSYGITEYGTANYDFYGNPRIRYNPSPLTRCNGDDFEYFKPPATLTDWYRDAAFTGEKSGFVNAMASTVKTSVAGVTTDIWGCYANGSTGTQIDDFAEIVAFACCGVTVHSKRTLTWDICNSKKLVRTSTTYTGGACCILLHQEREGILVMTKAYDVGQETGYDNIDSGTNVTNTFFELSAAYLGLGACWTDIDLDGWQGAANTNPDNFPGGPQVNRAAVNYDSTTGNWYLALGLQSYSGALPMVGTAIRSDIDLAFTNPIPARELELTVFALHGGMSYAPADPAATQPTNFPALTNQVNSNAYLFPTDMVTNGGFLSDGFAPVAFVGQA